MFNKPPKGTPYNYAHPLARGLIGYWLFNEGGGTKAYDISTKQRHGTLNNFALTGNTSNWAGSQMGGGLLFDGSNDFVNVSNANFPFVTAPFSVSAWVKPQFANSNYNAIVSKGGTFESASNFVLGIRGQPTTTDYRAYIFWKGGATLYGNEFSVPILGSQTWMHIVGVVDSAWNSEVYVNGYSVGTDGSNSAATDGSQPLKIGSPNTIGTELAYNGYVDEVRIYSRALNASDVKLLYINPHADFLFDKHYINPTLYGLGAWGGRLTNAGGSGTLTAISANKTIESYMVLGFKKQ